MDKYFESVCELDVITYDAFLHVKNIQYDVVME